MNMSEKSKPISEPETTPDAVASEPKVSDDVVDAPAPEVVPVSQAEPEPVKVSKPSKFATPVAVSAEDIANALPAPAGPAVVSNNIVDDVVLSAIIFKNIYSRKSLSVHHMQRRLAELGYSVAALDKDGFYGDRTKEALAAFQANKQLPGDGNVDPATLTALFDGDPNVRVIL
jgi:hypothetical protein